MAKSLGKLQAKLDPYDSFDYWIDKIEMEEKVKAFNSDYKITWLGPHGEALGHRLTSLGDVKYDPIYSHWDGKDWLSELDKAIQCGQPALEFKDGVASTEIDLPGVKKEDVNITVLSDRIRITSKRKENISTTDLAFIPGTSIDEAGSEAELENGVLMLTIRSFVPKTANIKIK